MNLPWGAAMHAAMTTIGAMLGHNDGQAMGAQPPAGSVPEQSTVCYR